MKKLMALFLCICMFTALAPVTTFAAAENIKVTSADYYDNGDVKSIDISFGWDSASASSRLTVMTERLRSAGESGTDGSYGDFTDLGYYGKQFKSWDEVMAQKNKFGILYYTDEQTMNYDEANSISLHFERGDIPMNSNRTYYVYLWTSWKGQYYPDNLFMALQVKGGKLQYASATDRNKYGSFTVLKNGEQSAPTSAPSSTKAPSSTQSGGGVDSPTAKYEQLSLNDFEWEVVRLCNIERAKEGLDSLSVIGSLQSGCDVREKEIASVFSHTRPDGSDCYSVLTTDFSYVGENIARGQYNPAMVVDAWMNSPGHRANILNSEYSYIGVGYNSDGNNWVQLFAKGKAIKKAQTNAPTTKLSENDITKYYLTLEASNGYLSYMPLDFAAMRQSGSSYLPRISCSAVPVFEKAAKTEEAAATAKPTATAKPAEEEKKTVDLTAGGIFERYIPIAKVYGINPKGDMPLEKGKNAFIGVGTRFQDESSYGAPELKRCDFINHYLKLNYLGTIKTIDTLRAKSMRIIPYDEFDKFIAGESNAWADKAKLTFNTIVVSIDLYDGNKKFVRNISPGSVILMSRADGSFITYSNSKSGGAYLLFLQSDNLYEPTFDSQVDMKNMQFAVEKSMLDNKSDVENLLPDVAITEYKYTPYPALSGNKQYNTNIILSENEFVTADGTYYRVGTEPQVMDPMVKHEIKNVVSYAYYTHSTGVARYDRLIVTSDGTLYAVSDTDEKKTVATGVKKATANHYLTNNGEVKEYKSGKTVMTGCADMEESNDGLLIGIMKTDGSFYLGYSYVEAGDGYAKGLSKVLDNAKGVVANGVVDKDNTFYRFDNRVTAGQIDMNAFASGIVKQEYTLESGLTRVCYDAVRIFPHEYLSKNVAYNDEFGNETIFGFVQSSNGTLYGYSSKYHQSFGGYGAIERIFPVYTASKSTEGNFVGIKVANESVPYAVVCRYCDGNTYRWGKMVSANGTPAADYVCETQGGYYATDGKVYGVDSHPVNSGKQNVAVIYKTNEITNFPNMHRATATYGAYSRTKNDKVELLPSVYTWFNDNSRISLLERTDGSMWMAAMISTSNAELLAITGSYESSNVFQVSQATTNKAAGECIDVNNMSFPGSAQATKPQFVDVAPGAWYAAPVAWAVEKAITAGTSATTFSPDNTCTRAQILTFLWRAVGSPKMSGANPFYDVKESDYYYDAAIWASSKGMVTGGAFAADTPCTRSATVVYLWQNAGSPNASYTGNFADVSSGSAYAQAVAWAVSNGVTSGTSDTTFSPDTTCTRGQIVTFLQRALQK